MPRPQTRRSVSVKAITHQRIKDYVTPRGDSVASFVEMAIDDYLGEPADEDHRKFGELVEQREKESEAARAAQKDSNELQAPTPLPDPPTPDKPRGGPVEAVPEPTPEPEFNLEPERELVKKIVVAFDIPKDAFQPAGPGPAPKPELPRKAVPAPPEPKRDKILRHGAQIRKLSKGVPAEEVKQPPEPEGFEDYVPPIFQL